MDASRLMMPGLPCDLCGRTIPEDTGVFANKGKKTVKFCAACLRKMVQANECRETVDMQEVGGVWYTPADKPFPPPITGTSRKTRSSYVIYEEPTAPPPQEPLKYNPIIPPRRKPGT